MNHRTGPVLYRDNYTLTEARVVNRDWTLAEPRVHPDPPTPEPARPEPIRWHDDRDPVTQADLHATDWMRRGACLNKPDLDFGDTVVALPRKRRICAGCPVNADCYADAVARRPDAGVWAGLTPTEIARQNA